VPPYKDRPSLAVEARVTDSEPILPLARAPAAQFGAGPRPSLGRRGRLTPIQTPGSRTSTFPLKLSSPTMPSAMLWTANKGPNVGTKEKRLVTGV
jgi:hypothetical protein